MDLGGRHASVPVTGIYLKECHDPFREVVGMDRTA